MDPIVSTSTADLELAFPKLTQDQIESLSQFGKPLSIKKGGDVWLAGTPNVCMFVVLSGTMQIVDGRSQDPIALHEPGAFSGDIDVISGRPAVVSARAAEDLELLEVQGDCVRSIVAESPVLGEIILRAFLLRRAILQKQGNVGVLVLGSRFSADALRVREFLVHNRYPVRWEDLEGNADAEKLLAEFGVSDDDTPVVVLPNGRLLRKPTNAELADALGVNRPLDSTVYDVVIVGAGPAGLAAAVYGASEGLQTLLVDSHAPGGQAGTSSLIENYMGFPLGLSGQDLADRAVAQAEKFGAQMIAPVDTLSLTCGDHGLHELEISTLGKVLTRTVVLATGAHYRELDVPRMENFEGRGIYYAATSVERLVCEQSAVAVVGAGNSAGQAAVFMSEKAAHIYLIVRGDDLRKSMSSYLAKRIERLEANGRLTLLLNSEICELHGETGLEEVTIRECVSGLTRKEPLKAIFVMIGAQPRTKWIEDCDAVALDKKGFVLTGNDVVANKSWPLDRHPYFLEASCPGVFAAGDVRSGSVKRVASAVGEGSMAIAFIHQYLAN